MSTKARIDEELPFLCESLGFPEETRALIARICSSEPSRRVRSSRYGNVSGRYPSRKMQVVIQFESHKSEFAHIKEREYNRNVLWYFDQPEAMKLSALSAAGRQIGYWHTADFFVIQKDGAGWEECKTEDELIRLSEQNPNRYRKDNDGRWHHIPGEQYAEPYGLYYRVHTSRDINWTFQRSVEFLEDYCRVDSPAVGDEAKSSVISIVASEPGITVETLFQKADGAATRDDVLMMIATDQIYVDLHRYDIVEFDKALVYPDEDTSLAYERVIVAPPMSERPGRGMVNILVGNIVSWDGTGWRIANVGETNIGLLGEDQSLTELPITTFEALVRSGAIVGADAAEPQRLHPEAEKLFLSAGPREFAIANRRAEMLQAYERGESVPGVSLSTLRLWDFRKKSAVVVYDNGYIGLLPLPRRGNPADKLPGPVRDRLNKFVLEEYETYKQKGRMAAHREYRRVCEKEGIDSVSYKTFRLAVKQRPRHGQTLKREGHRAAYKYKSFYWELDYTTPPHGDHPFHIGHIDHTQLDVESICTRTGTRLGRPWLSTLVGANPRRFFAIYMTFDPPSYRSVMMLVRDCVRRYGRLPQIIVMDGGKEFSSVYLETLLARYECTKKTRPPSEGRFGNVVERLFGTVHSQFIHCLAGNTKIMTNVRQVTKSVNPATHAVWDLQSLYERTCEYAFEVYDNIPHPALGQSPREAFAFGMARNGQRLHRMIPYDERFRMLTLPTTRKGTSKVWAGRGFKIGYIYYWSDTFRDPRVELTTLPVRYDPWDASVAYAYANGQWVRCISQYYKQFRGRSERELMLATAVLRKRLGRSGEQSTITAKLLADFMASAEAEEALLKQRLTDMAGQGVRTTIDGVQMPQTSGEPYDPTGGGEEDSEGGAQEPDDESPDAGNLRQYGEF